MSESAPALLLGRSEIDRVARLLDQLGVGYEHIPAPLAMMTVPTPRSLLVVSGECLTLLPTFAELPGADPVRVCIHGQDFLPLRQHLRELGFHYLVQSALDQTSLRVLFKQLLHTGAGKRRSERLPLGGRIEYRSPEASGTARLADLSRESCRILGAAELRLDSSVTVVLPSVLGGGKTLSLEGQVMRLESSEAAGEEPGHAAVVRFSVLTEDARERLDRLLRGELIGARVTALAEAPGIGGSLPAETPPADPADPTDPTDPAGGPSDRRREVRHPYQGRVDIFEVPGDADGVLGRDLSLDGVCISSGQGLKLGMKLTVALYGGHRREPVVVEAEAIRVGPDEAALAFGRLSEEQQDKLACLIAEQPALERLEAEPRDSRVVAAQILRRDV